MSNDHFENDFIDVFVNGRQTRIQVPDRLKAQFNDNFVRSRPSDRQRQYKILMNLMSYAYAQGSADRPARSA